MRCGVPMVTEMPAAGRGAESVVAEREAFDLLATVVQAQLPRRRQKTVLVTSALDDKGKATVTAGLSRALAQSGEAALVVDADLRRPSLEQLFGMERAPGLAEILAAIRHGDTETAAGMIVEPPASASSSPNCTFQTSMRNMRPTKENAVVMRAIKQPQNKICF